MTDQLLALVEIPEHQYKDTTLATACNWVLYDIPEQVGAIVLKKQPGTGTAYLALEMDAVEVESYYVSRLFSSSSVDHKTDVNRPTKLHFSHWGDSRSLAYWLKVLIDLGHIIGYEYPPERKENV